MPKGPGHRAASRQFFHRGNPRYPMNANQPINPSGPVGCRHDWEYVGYLASQFHLDEAASPMEPERQHCYRCQKCDEVEQVLESRHATRMAAQSPGAGESRAMKISRSVKHSNSPAAALLNQPAARPPATERSPALVTVSQGMVVPEVIPAGSRTSSHATSNSDCSPETGHPLNVKTSKESGNGTDDQVRESQSLRS